MKSPTAVMWGGSMKTTGAMWDAKVSDGSSQHPLEISGVKVTAWAESRLPQ